MSTAPATDTLPDGTPLILIQSGPYSDSLARAALDVAMSFAVFAQSPSVVFSGDGIRCLASAQQPEDLGRKSLRKIIDSLPLYDIETLFADSAALARFGIAPETLPPGTVILDDASLGVLCGRASHVLSF